MLSLWVEEAAVREETAACYHLMGERIGDVVVGADRDTVFGTLEYPSEELGPGYRNHDSHHEEAVPIVAWNLSGGFARWDEVEVNFDLTRLVFFE